MEQTKPVAMSLINTPRLIHEVYIRPPLWNHHIVSGKETIERLWTEVAEAMENREKDVKTKWKNLKDQFRKEMKKAVESGPNYVPSWSHYSRLLFLSEVLLQSKRISYSSDEVSFPQVHVEVSKFESEDSYQDYRTPDYPQPPTSVSPKRRRENEEDEDERTSPAGPPTVLTSSAHFPSSPWEVYNGDEDYHFFMSLIPHMKKFSSLQKLRVRNKIQQVVIEEIQAETNQSRASSSTEPIAEYYGLISS